MDPIKLFSISDLICATSAAIRNISEDVPCILPRVFYRHMLMTEHWMKMTKESPFIAYYINSFNEDDMTILVTHLFNSFLNICTKVRCIQGVTKQGCVWPTLERDLVTLTKCNVIEKYGGPSEIDLGQKRFTVAQDVRDENPVEYNGHWFFVTIWICLRCLENIYSNALMLVNVASNYVFIPAVIEAIAQLGPKGRIFLSKIWDKDSMGLSIITVTYSASWSVLGSDNRRGRRQHYNSSSNDIGVRRQYADTQLYKTILSRVIATRIILSDELKNTEDEEFVKYIKETNMPIDIVAEVLYSFIMADDNTTMTDICRSIGLNHVISLDSTAMKSITFLYTLARDAVEAHSKRFIRLDSPGCLIPYHSIYLLLTSSGVFQRMGELVQWHAAYHIEKKTINTRQHIRSIPVPMEPLMPQRLKMLIKGGYASIVDGRLLLEHRQFDQFRHFILPTTHCTAVAALFSMARFIRDSRLSTDLFPVYPFIETSWYTGSASQYAETTLIAGRDNALAIDRMNDDGDEDGEDASLVRHEFELLTEINKKLTDTGLSGLAPLVANGGGNANGQSLHDLVERLLAVAKSRLTSSLLDSMMDADAIVRNARVLGSQQQLPSISTGFIPGKNVMITRCLNGCIVSMSTFDFELFGALSVMMTRLNEKKIKSYTGPISGIVYKLYKTDRKQDNEALHRTVKSIVYQYILSALLSTVRFGASHTLAYVSLDRRPMDILHRDSAQNCLHPDISKAMLQPVDQIYDTSPSESSLIELPIDFYEFYLERVIDIVFPTHECLVHLLKETMETQFSYMSDKKLENRQAPRRLKTIVLFFLQKLATRIPKKTAAKLSAYLQAYIYSTEYIEQESNKRRIIATAYRILELMIPYSDEFYTIPRAQDMLPSYCLEVEPIGILFAAVIECPAIDEDEKHSILTQIEAIRDIQMAAPQSSGTWIHLPDEAMLGYNQLYGNDHYENILKNPSLRDAWINEQPRLGLFFLVLELLNNLRCIKRPKKDANVASHFDTLGSFKPDFRKWNDWKMEELLKSGSTCGFTFFTNMHINNKFRQVLASPISVSILSSASVGIYANMLQE